MVWDAFPKKYRAIPTPKYIRNRWGFYEVFQTGDSRETVVPGRQDECPVFVIGVVSGKAIFGPPLEEYWTKKLQEEASKKKDEGSS